jgi:hypothetical protein
LKGEEKDRKPTRVGGLERDKPILLLIDTPEHRPLDDSGFLKVQVYGRRQGLASVMAGGESTLEG